MSIERPRCGARTRAGHRCGLPAGHGTEHVGVGRCRRHGGNTPGQVEHARRALALRELAVMGGSIPVEPTDALLGCVYRAAGQAMWLRGRVESLSPEEVLCLGAHEIAVPHIWVRLEQEALDRLARVSKMALDGGVAERQVQIAERTGQLIAAALDDAISPLALSDGERTAVVKRFAARLAPLEHTSEEVMP